VNEEPTVGEDAYVWFGSVFPLACDVVNARFTFEALTATTASRLHYPAYDKFLKEMDKYVTTHSHKIFMRITVCDTTAPLLLVSFTVELLVGSCRR
jgi:hypothetical protein